MPAARRATLGAAAPAVDLRNDAVTASPARNHTDPARLSVVDR
jgi:hypothetical protein